MFSIIDALSYPLRWIAAHVMAMAIPDFFDRVCEDVPALARRETEAAMDSVGLDATGEQFVEELLKRLDRLDRESNRLLLAYSLLNGFQCREALWTESFWTAQQRRVQ